MTKRNENLAASQPQAEKFKAMAKELEADGDEKAFDDKLKKISTNRTKSP